MKTLLRLLKGLVMVFAALCAIAGGIFLFTNLEGLKGYVLVLLGVSAAWTGLGALWVYAGNKSSLTVNGVAPESYDDPAMREIARDSDRGTTLGLEAFYSGLAAVLIVYSIYKNLFSE